MTKTIISFSTTDKLQEYVNNHKKFLITYGNLSDKQKSRILEIEKHLQKGLSAEEAKELGSIYKIAQENSHKFQREDLKEENLEEIEKDIETLKASKTISKEDQETIDQFNARGSFLEYIAREQNIDVKDLALSFAPEQIIDFDLSGADLSNISFSGVKFNAPLNESVNMNHCDLRSATFRAIGYTKKDGNYELSFNFPTMEKSLVDDSTTVFSVGYTGNLGKTEHSLERVASYNQETKNYINKSKTKTQDPNQKLNKNNSNKTELLPFKELALLAAKTLGTSAYNNFMSLNAMLVVVVAATLSSIISATIPMHLIQIGSVLAAYTTIATAKDSGSAVKNLLTAKDSATQQQAKQECKIINEKNRKQLRIKHRIFQNIMPNQNKIFASLIIGAAIAVAPLTAGASLPIAIAIGIGSDAPAVSGASLPIAIAIGIASAGTTYVAYNEVANKMKQAKKSISSYFSKKNTTTRTEHNTAVSVSQQAAPTKEAQQQTQKHPNSPEPTPVTNHEQQLSARRSKSSQDRGPTR